MFGPRGRSIYFNTRIGLPMVVRLRDLAEHLDLSITQVSRALGDHADVSVDTKVKVREAAEQLGYRPSSSARRLKSGKTGSLGLVIPPNMPMLPNSVVMGLTAAICDEATAAGFDLTLVAQKGGDDEMEPYQRLVREQRVDGMFVTRTRSRDPRVAYLAKSGFPFVTHGRSDPEQDAAWVDLDGSFAIRSACRRLLGLGHRRVGFVGVDVDHIAIQDRELGYRTEMAGSELLDESLIARVDPSSAATRGVLSDLMENGRPTAIICATDATTISLLEAVREFGYRPGIDLAVIGFGNTELGRLSDPPLTVVEHPIQEMGRTMVEFLLRRIAGEDPRNLRKMWKPKLRIRGTDVVPVT